MVVAVAYKLLKEFALHVGISYSSAWKAIKNLCLHPYHIHTVDRTRQGKMLTLLLVVLCIQQAKWSGHIG
jgi:hypothetical protein